MNNMYIALETLAALIILILLLANIFESKQKSTKRSLFTKLLIANEIVVVADAISYLPLGWSNYPFLLDLTIAITYIVPFFLQMIFALYIYQHISLKEKVDIKPFRFIVFFSAIEIVITTVLCFTRSLFYIEDGAFHSGPLEMVYYIMNIASLLYFVGVIIFDRKKMKHRDIFAATTFCVVPVLSVIITLITGLNLTVTLMSVTTLVMYIMLQSENERMLYGRANRDELTGLYNRAAFEDELNAIEKSENLAEFACVSVDVNGLKTANDTYGHTAGDELIRGAATCLKNVFGNTGKIFRIGGDEFSVLFFADEEKLKTISEEFDKATNGWSGETIKSLTLSVGYVTKKEFPDKSVHDLANIADKRMYDSKNIFYSKNGLDRRGQNDAYKALCSLYTKILKIDLANDSFSVVSMDVKETQKKKGYSESISKWLSDFGKSGQVHEEDLAEYLEKTEIEFIRNHFKHKKTSLSIQYRRKYGKEFKKVMMEIIPAGEEQDSKETYYLYVKNIDM